MQVRFLPGAPKHVSIFTLNDKYMKLSKILHVVSIVMGLIGVAMSAWVVLFWPTEVVWFGVTRNIMMFCSITSLLAMMLEKRGESF